MIDGEFLQEELTKISLLNSSWWVKFKLRVLAGEASVRPEARAYYYIKFQEAQKQEKL